MIDTNIAIALRDGDSRIVDKLASLADAVIMSVVTRIELEGGVHRYPEHAPLRRARLDAMLIAIPVLPFDNAAADCYRAIVVHAGYSRRKILDRMIAAQALAHRSSLATLNIEDFRDVPGLLVTDWA